LLKTEGQGWVALKCHSRAETSTAVVKRKDSVKQITVKFGLQSITRQFADEATIGQIIGDANVKAGLGYSDNVRAVMNGVTMPASGFVYSGSTLTIETAANAKAGPDGVLVQFGLQSMERHYDGTVTARMIRTDSNLKAGLGFSDNVRVVMNGVTLPDDAIIAAGSRVTIETAANAKAN
jgi:hypothetical protein